MQGETTGHGEASQGVNGRLVKFGVIRVPREGAERGRRGGRRLHRSSLIPIDSRLQRQKTMRHLANNCQNENGREQARELTGN